MKLGLYRAGTDDVVDTPGCPVHSAGINHAIEVVRGLVHEFDVGLHDETTYKGDLRFLTVREGFAASEVLIGFVTGADCPARTRTTCQSPERKRLTWQTPRWCLGLG